MSLYSFIEGISKRSEKEPKKHGNDAVQYQLKKWNNVGKFIWTKTVYCVDIKQRYVLLLIPFKNSIDNECCFSLCSCIRSSNFESPNIFFINGLKAFPLKEQHCVSPMKEQLSLQHLSPKISLCVDKKWLFLTIFDCILKKLIWILIKKVIPFIFVFIDRSGQFKNIWKN